MIFAVSTVSMGDDLSVPGALKDFIMSYSYFVGDKKDPKFLAGPAYCFLRLLAVDALFAALLPIAFLGVGCTQTVYKPSPEVRPNMTAFEAPERLGDSLERVQVGGMLGQWRGIRSMRSTLSGVSFFDPPGADALSPTVAITATTISLSDPMRYLSEPSQSYRFLDIKGLAVIKHNYAHLYEVYLGNVPIFWHDFKDACTFVDSIYAIRYFSSGLPLADDTEDFAEFREKAVEWRALAQNPAVPEEALRFQAQAQDAFRRQDLNQAAHWYEKALEAWPLWPEGHYNAALLNSEAGLYASAICHMKRYLELQPDAPDAEAARQEMAAWEEKVP